MQFKGQCDKFVVDKENSVKFRRKENYLFIHPNFDEWEQHLSRESERANRKILVKYTLINNSVKGQHTYNYFNLKELEINTFDEAQGIEHSVGGDASEAVVEARAIAANYDQ